MRALIIGSDSPLGQALNEFLDALGRHEVVAVTRSAARWKSERQAKKAVRRAQADVVVDLRIEALADGSGEIAELDLKRCQWIAKCCQRDHACHLFVSSSRVFSGQLDRLYHEGDAPDGDDVIGQALAAAERIVEDGSERSLILRLGPVFASQGTNLVTQMLGDMMSGRHLVLDNNLRGCPVASEDGARVISAVLDQLSTGADLWGIYHYCSAETTTYYEFAEAILASASQFSEFSADAVELKELEAGAPRLNRSLECSKIRNTFAVKQLPWRGAIAEQVKLYFSQQN